MIGYYNRSVVITYAGTLIGFAGIFFAVNGRIKPALICLMLSGLCDMFDGQFASRVKRSSTEKRFGIQIDSLSDLACFGILPAVISCSYCGMSPVICICASAYSLCALIRLAWFNVDEEDRQTHETTGREYYRGLPVTCSALIFPCVISACLRPTGLRIASTLMVLMLTAAAFLWPYRLKKPSLRGNAVLIFLGSLCLLLVLLSGTGTPS